MESKGEKAALKVLAGLKNDLAVGRYPPDTPITIQDEAARFKVSHIPVREALSYLAGEGLIRHTPPSGWRTFDVNPRYLVDLYEMHQLCVGFALARVSEAKPRGLGHIALFENSRGDGVFDEMVERAAQGALMAAYNRIRGQLQWLVSLERQIIGDYLQEQDCHYAGVDGDWTKFSRLSAAYHDRRIGAADEIATVANRMSGRSLRRS